MSRITVRGGRAAAPLVALATLLVAAWPALATLQPLGWASEALEGGGHLVISELQTGGASASDEFVELYNPSEVELPLEGLELVYVTASGSTVTRKAGWELGTAGIGPGRHLLVANEAGAYATIADLTYANGVAATGGAWALRIQGAATAVDAVGWGTATAWLEARPAVAPGAGSSAERLPGGALGSTQDLDDNLVDFVVNDVPDPQNLTAPAVPDPVDVTPSPTTVAPTASPTPSSTPSPTTTPPTPTPIPTPTPPSPEPTVTVAEARALPEGTAVTVRGTTLTDGTFGEGGGYLADATGGIAVLLDDGTFPRGEEIAVTGTLDDRYGQRTVRAAVSGLTLLGPATDPVPLSVATGEVGEDVEGQLVVIDGSIAGSGTALAGGLAIDVDDGSGPVRVFVGTATGIDIGAWAVGTAVALRGVVGQRDSTGTGSAGYRVQPREPDDVIEFVPASPSPSPTPSASSTGSSSPSSSPSTRPSASPSPSVPLVTIADARAAATNARLRLRGVVTVPSGLVEPGSAVVQDGSGAILVRLGDEAGSLARGELVELTGMRSTKSGMLSIRVSEPAQRLGRQAEPAAVRVATGVAGEAHEALLVLVRGAVTGRASRLSAGGVSFEIDDGSGPLRVAFSGRAGLGATPAIGTWIEVRGALGQETAGAQPQRGYRLWPRAGDDVTVVATAGAGSVAGDGGDASASEADAAAGPDLVAPLLPGTGRATEPAAPPDGTPPGLATEAGSGQVGGSTPVSEASATHLTSGEAARRRVMGAGILLIGLAGVLSGGAAAWRTGLVARLRRSADGPDDPAAPGTGEVEAVDEPGLARLSVIPGSGREPT